MDLSLFERAVARASPPPAPKPSSVALVPRALSRPPALPTRYDLGLLGSAAEVFANDPNAAAELARTRQVWQKRAIAYDQSIPEVWYCVDDQTEALTREGWKLHSDLREGDELLTLNTKTGLSEWQPALGIHHFEVDGAQMLRMRGILHSSVTTLGHRWPVWQRLFAESGWRFRWTTSAKLNMADQIITGAPHAGLPTEPKWSDAFVELVGWFFTEGTCRRNPTQDSVRSAIYQSQECNPEWTTRIRACLREVFGPPRATLRYGRTQAPPAWREAISAGGMVVFHLNTQATAQLLEVAPDRIVTRRFVDALTAAQLDLFITTAVRADGYRTQLAQKDHRRLESIERALILSGRTPHTYPTSGGMTQIHWRDRSYVGPYNALARGGRSGGTIVEVIRYTGTVWCPTTLNQTWLARRDGTVYYTGNTNNHFANTVAGGRLFAGRIEEPGQDPVEITDPNDLAVVTLSDIGNGMESSWGQQGQAALIRASAWHLLVPGEFYAGMWADPDTGDNVWDVFSISEIEQGSRGLQVRRYPGEQPVEIPQDAVIRRIWWPDPQWHSLAVSPMKAQMDVLEELSLLGAAGIASLWSRLVTAGILKVPSEIDFGKDVEGNTVEFIDLLQKAMMTAMRDPRSVARFVPISAKAKGEVLQYMEHMTLGKDTTETELDRRKEAIERYARGAPVPKERVLGFGEAKYWNVFAIKEDEWGHYAPVVDVLLWGWTVAFLRPLLEGSGYPDAQSIVIGYDRSPIVGKPDKSTSATEGLTLGVLAPRVWRREHDYEEEDAPTPEEWEMMLQWKVGGGGNGSSPGPPPSTPGAPAGTPQAPPANAPPGTITAAARPQRRELQRLGRALGGIDRALMLRLTTAADAALQRAAERAGAKIRARVLRSQRHMAIAQALDGLHNDRVASHLGRRRVTELGFDEDALIEGSAAAFVAKARPWLAGAQREALKRIAQATDRDLDLLEKATVTTRESGLASALGKLADGFTAKARAYLYDPSPEVDLPGEVPDLSAPHGAIREALALAGGGERGIGSGPLAQQALGAAGYSMGGFMWNYGDEPRKTFPGHLALDGEVFASEDDPALAVMAEDNWLGVPFYRPGDHEGCRCSLDPQIIETGVESEEAA